MFSQAFSGFLFLQVLVAVADGYLLGCYSENRGNREFKFNPGNYGYNNTSPELCMTLCARFSYQYAGLYAGKFCFCSNVLTQVNKVGNGMCDIDCSGKPGVKCGSHSHNSVYRVQTPLQGAKVFSESSGYMITGEERDFKVTVAAGDDDFYIQVDKGDGGGRGNWMRASNFTASFTIPGVYTMTVYLKDVNGTYTEIQTVMGVSVQSRVDGVELKCPNISTTFDPIECTATVTSGTYMSVKADFGDGNTDSFPIADALISGVGPPIPEEVPQNTISKVYNLLVMPSAEVREEGKLVGFEFMSSGAGTVTFHILEPNCNVYSYCFTDNACKSTCKAETSCESNEMYCHANSVCTESSLTAACSAPTVNRYSAASIPFGYRIKSNIVHSVCCPGRKLLYLNASSYIDVKQGDVIGYAEGSNIIAVKNCTDVNQTGFLYTGSMPYSNVLSSSDFVASGTHSLLRGIVSQPSVVKLHKVYEKAGSYNLSVVTKNDLIAYSTAASASVMVMTGINDTTIEGPSYAFVNEEVEFYLLPHTGSDITYTWTFSDGVNKTTSVPKVGRTFTSVGRGNVTVRAENALTTKENSTTFIVNERVSNVTLHGDTAIGTNEINMLWLNMTTGDAYTCDWRYGDMTSSQSNSSTTPKTGGSVSHTYVTPGVYTTTVNCSNQMSSDTAEITQTVLNRITVLRLIEKGAEADKPIAINFTTDGSNVSFTLLFDNTTVAVTFDPTTGIGSSSPIDASSTYGAIPLVLTASNLLGSKTIKENFTIEGVIKNPKLETYKPVLGINETAIFTVTIEEGTSVAITINYGDQTNDTYSVAAGVDWVTGSSVNFTHTYLTAGDYQAIVTISNAISTHVLQAKITMLNKVEGIEVTTAPFVPLVNGLASVRIAFNQAYGSVPLNAAYTMDVSCDPETKNRGNYTGQALTFTLKNTAICHIAINVSNPISFMILSARLEVLRPVEGLTLKVEPPHATPNEIVSVITSMSQGDNVTLHLDYGLGPTSEVQPGRTNIKSYPNVGDYTIELRAENPLGNTTLKHVISIQVPVTDNFTMENNAPVLCPGTLSMNISYPGLLDVPTSATVNINWGDGSPVETRDLAFLSAAPDYRFSFSKNYATTGNYKTTTVISNKVSSISKTFDSGMYCVISGYRVTTGPRTIGMPSNVYYSGKAVTFESTTVKGPVKCTRMLAVAENGDLHYCQSEGNQLSYRFPDGKYNVTINGSNPFSYETFLLSIRIDPGVYGVKLTDVAYVSKPDERKYIVVSFLSVDEHSCLQLEWGDGSSNLYGNTEACRYTFSEGAPIEDITNPMNVSHVYAKEGEYNVSAYAKSNDSDTKDILLIPISSLDCVKPELTIINRQKTVMKKDKLTVEGVVTLNCTITHVNIKAWVLRRIDSDTGELTPVDTSRIASSSSSKLVIPPHTLGYGVYSFEFSVRMDGKASIFWNEVKTTIEITKSDLVVSLFPGDPDIVTRGFGSEVVIDAAANSRDPDASVQQSLGRRKRSTPGDFEYKFYCKRDDEVFPKYANGTFDSRNTSSPYAEDTLSQLRAAGTFVDNGGCFSQGPGRISVHGDDTGKLSFSTATMFENKTYEICVIVRKDTRQGMSCVKLKIVMGDPPSVGVACGRGGLCVRNTCGHRINPSRRLALIGSCQDKCPSMMRYDWSILYWMNDTWHFVDDVIDFTEDVTSKDIAIQKEMFERYSAATKFQATLSISAATGMGTAGATTFTLCINKPPYNGSCDVQPKISVAAVDGSSRWNLSCNGWTDPEGEGIDMYRFFVTHAGEGNERQVMFSSQSDVSISLPVGKRGSNYTLQLQAWIGDVSGGLTKYDMGTIQVRPGNESDIQEILNSIVSKPTSYLTKTLNSGSLEEITTLVTSIGSQMNSLPDEDTNTADTETGAKVREMFVDGLVEASKSASTMSDISQISTSMNEVVVKVDEVSRNGQGASAAGISTIVGEFDRLSKDTSVEELAEVALGLIFAIGYVEHASNFHMSKSLQLDIARAEDKKDYDTNLDSTDQWSEQGSLDAADHALLLETNTKEQWASASNVVTKTRNALQTICVAVAKNKIAGDNVTIFETKQMFLSIDKNKASEIVNTSQVIGAAAVSLPSWCDMVSSGSCNTDDVLTFVASVDKTVPYSFINSSGVSPDSQAVSLDFIADDGFVVEVKETRKSIEIQIPRNQDIPVVELLPVHPFIPNNTWSFLAFQKLNVSTPNSSLHVELVPDDPEARFLILIKLGGYPNITTGVYDYHFTIPLERATDGRDNYTAFVDSVGKNTGTYFIGIRQIDGMEETNYLSNRKPSIPEPFSGRFTTNYTMRIYTSGCFFEHKLAWETHGCKVGPLTTINSTQCFCNHLTTFAGGWIVQPNLIDFNFVFNNMSLEKNPTIYATLGVIFGVYILVAIWARRKDRQDTVRIGVTPMPDNDANDKYLYEVVVFTGLRKNAGTDSKVHIIFSGDESETDVRILEDPKRKLLRRGGMDSFLMAVPGPLGDLNYARVWHDNSGKGKFGSWYLKYIMVLDLQTKRKDFFIANQWFAVEEGDGQVDRLLPVAGKEQMTAFGHLFTKTSQKDLGDGHLWFSVIARPVKSRFTRLQRVSCCLSLLYLTMLTNAMFTGQAENQSGALEFGPFSLSPEQISIGVISNLIVFPVNLILITLFRKSRPKRKRPSRIAEAMKLNSVASSEGDVLSKQSDRPASSSTDTETEIEIPEKQRNKKKKKKFELPWWCIIPAWVFLWITVLGAAAMVLFYGISFQDEKVRSWITALVISFFTSVFLTQPIKVVLLAAFFALVVKTPSTDDEEEGENDEEEPQLAHDEQWLHKKDASFGAAKPRKIAYKPPDPATLELAREKRLKELQMFDIIREIIFYAVFLWLLIVVSYSNRDPNAFRIKDGFKRFLATPQENANTSFEQVIMTKSYWYWLEKVLIPGIRASRWYNNDQPLFQRGYFDDRVSRIMGHATIRQLRIKRMSCVVPHTMAPLLAECNEAYNMDNEDRLTYARRWETAMGNETNNPEYVYQSADELEGYPYFGQLAMYGGGGYTVRLTGGASNLLKHIEQLKREAWIDRYTRAVFVEFTTYNAYVNLFGVATILAEFPESGGVITSYRFEPVRLLNYIGSAMLFQLICEISFGLFIVFFMVKEIRNLVREKKSYFSHFWNWVEMIIICFAIVSAAIYIYRIVLADELTTKFKETKGNKYMKFQYVAYWNEILTYMIGILVFFATCKFLKLLRFNRRMSILGATLSHASKGITVFMVMFTIIFFAFVQLFYFLLGRNLLNYSSIPRCLESSFQIILGKFNFYELRMANSLAVVFFFAYMVTVVFVLINMLLSILNESFSAVKNDLSKQTNDYEMVDFLVSRFKAWTGFSNEAPKEKDFLPELADQNALPVTSTIEGQVDTFPEKVERLLQSISKVYFEHDKYDAMFSGIEKRDAFNKQTLKMILKEHQAHGKSKNVEL